MNNELKVKKIDNIKELAEKETEKHLAELLPQEDVIAFKNMLTELKDTWYKKQIFRTETEARISVLQDLKYPTKAAKYWQCVREQSHYLDNLLISSFEFRKNTLRLKKVEKKIQNAKTEASKEWWQIRLDELKFHRAGMEVIAKDRMRELKMWSKLKKEFDDGTFDTKDVNTHQLQSYKLRMINKVNTITQGTSQADVFNLVGQHQTIQRVEAAGELKYDKKEELTLDKKE